MCELLQSLDQLQDAVELVFGRITKRVELEHERLHELSRRIQSAKAKVDAISGTKRAITVFSSTKYPVVPPELINFTPLFGGDGDGMPPVCNVEVDGGSWQENENDGTLELYRFFMETSHERLTAVTRDADNSPLGLSSVADALLFKPSDLEHQSSQIREQSSESYKKPVVLPPPPQSLTRTVNQTAPGLEDYVFKPALREVPLISLPSTLPDLPMVADIKWTGSKDGTRGLSTIAPSAVIKTPQRSDGESTQRMSSVLEVPSPSSPVSSSSSSVKNVSRDAAPSFMKPIERKGKEKIGSPPPPPPPLPSPPISGRKPSPQESLPSVDPERAALMASIRSPNIKLRKTGLMDYTEKSSEQSHQSEQPKQDHLQQRSDLLAEMAATLKMRRLSMKGASHDASKVPKSPNVDKPPLPISNLQAFIPPSARSDDEDDDDDDWEE